MGEEPAARTDPPAEIQALVDRNASCNALATHPEPDSVAQLEAQRLYFKCDAVAQDEAALRQKYIGNPAILKLLDAKWVRIVKRVPLKIAPQANPADTSKGPTHIIDR